MSARKSSHGTIFLIVSSGSPLALIASSLRSKSKKLFCPMTRSLPRYGQRVRFAATWREEFFEAPFRKSFDHRGKYDASHEFGVSNRQLARSGIRKELDVPDALLQFVEGCEAALKQRLAIASGLDALWVAVKQPHPERVLKIGDHFRHGRLRDAEIRSCLRHAAALHDREKQMQVPQLQPPANVGVRIDRSRHKKYWIGIEEIWEFPLYQAV